MTEENFRDFVREIEPIRMREPLAALLGAFKGDGDVVRYGFDDVVKMSGHACPTVSVAFVACKHALLALYGNELPERGSIAITIHGERDEGACGVIGQVFSFVTGACTETGFKGLGGLHRRNNLLRFATKDDDASMRFDFARLDRKAGCKVRIFSSALPSLEADDEQRMSELMEKNIWQGAGRKERDEFRDLWMRRVEMIAFEERNIVSWLKIEKTEV